MYARRIGVSASGSRMGALCACVAEARDQAAQRTIVEHDRSGQNSLLPRCVQAAILE